jgi:hypothetical protein
MVGLSTRLRNSAVGVTLIDMAAFCGTAWAATLRQHSPRHCTAR